MSNSNKRWTKEDKILLLTEFTKNVNIKDIANKLQRSETAIISHIHKLLLENTDTFNNNYINFLKSSTEKSFSILVNSINKTNTSINKTTKQSNSIKSSNIVKNMLDEMVTIVEDNDELYDTQFKSLVNVIYGKNVFITGEGGTGKSKLIKHIVKYQKKHKIKHGVTASTGAAATLIDGTTIHSFLNIGLATKSVSELSYKINATTKSKIRNIKLLIIDEISMIDNKLFSKISKLLSIVRNDKTPFGGIQVVLVGDFTQLPPVKNDYCFKSKTWKKLKLVCISLDKQMRQSSDPEFQKMLSYLRFNKMTTEIYNKLEKQIGFTLDSEIKPTVLYSKNKNVDEINNKKYQETVQKNNFDVYKFSIKYDESNKKIKKLIEKRFKNEPYINLCKNLQVMVTFNIDIDNNIVNGTRGVITHITDSEIYIKTINKPFYKIPYIDLKNDDGEILYSFIPLKLAYALTIHKIQGSTLDYVKMNIGSDVFTYGQAYTALSRAKELKNINIISLNKNAFICNPDVKSFYEKMC